jgi:hypothetical protein
MAVDSPVQTGLLFNLETPQLVAIDRWQSYLKGWFVPPERVESWRLVVLVGGEEEPVYTEFPRPDVSRHLGIPRAGRSGFVARLRTPEPGQTVSLAVWMDGVITELVSGIGQQELTVLPDLSTGHEKVSSYKEWIFRREPLLFSPGAEAPRPSDALSPQPVISLLAEFGECQTYFLSEFLRSLSAQSYPHWQLCAAVDFTIDSEPLRVIQRFAAADRRVVLVPSSWNATLEAAEGEFVAPVRLYDELHPFALSEMAASLQGRELDLVYSDEDRIDLFGQRHRPQFKPDFDGERLLAINYVGRLAAIRRSLALSSGGLRSLPSGAREWDFLLRCVEQTKSDKVAHIAKPLYHLRTREALAEVGVKLSYAQSDDLCRVIREHVARTGKQAVVETGFPTDTIRLQYPIPNNVRTAVLLRDEDGIFQVAALSELVNKQQVTFYGTLNGIVHRLPQPGGSSGSVRRSPIVTLAEIAGDVLLFINRPIDLLSHFFLQELIAQALRPDCGVVAGLSIDLAGRFIHTGFIQSDQDRYADPFAGSNSRLKALGCHVRVTRSVRAISGDCFAVRREHADSVGGLSRLASIPQFVGDLIEHAHHHRLQVLVTPYSVGAFDRLEQFLPSGGLADWNPNLGDFSHPEEMLGS